MNWTNFLKQQIEATYGATEGLISFVDEGALDWKPSTGSNWMTTGQLLEHITNACGFCCKGFVAGDWGMPEGMSTEDMSSEGELPPAEAMPTAAFIAEVRQKLAADKALAIQMVEQSGEEKLDQEMVAAPWDPTQRQLGMQLSMMVGHLAQHKDQLFYYLKLQGNDVNTGHLYGM